MSPRSILFHDRLLRRGAGGSGRRLWRKPDPATREELFLPNACTSCHGGGDNFADNDGDVDGDFLAFDFNVFEYGTLTSRAENEANVKKLNQGVLKTDPPSAVKRLVRGLYGGKKLPLATQNSAYRPSSWDAEPALWNVVVSDCLGCHTLSESEVLDLDYWRTKIEDFREKVLQKQLMPNSPYANRRFFLETNHHQIVEGALNRFAAQ